MKTMIILLALACAGCDESAPRTYKTPDGSMQTDIIVDALTTCQYLVILGGSRYAGVTPRMGADGKQICGSRP